MKHLFFAVTILLVSANTFAQKFAPEQIIGVWKSEDYKIEFFKDGDSYAAKLLWSKDMFEADGKTSKKDDNNPDESLRDRPRQGITHITGLVYDDGEYLNGKLYSVQDGNTYGFKAELNEVDKLETRGYKGVAMLGKTVHWTRVP